MTTPKTKRELLRGITFGQRVAEEETDALATYFVETDYWDRLIRGDIDIVYGHKGAGKSALYALLSSRRDELFDRRVLLVPAENPRGAPVFRDLLTDPPASEREFVGLWKLYFAALIHSVLKDFDVRNAHAKELEAALVRENLAKGTSLSSLLRGVVQYVKRALRPQSVEGEIKIDPATQMPAGFGGKIMFSEPDSNSSDPDLRSVDQLLQSAQHALQEADLSAWILLDRLDVAFAENDTLEANALRALFRVYLDLLAYPAIRLKIFLRSDIWDRISAEGFREASHVTRHVTISWNRNSLLNLIVRRCLFNKDLRECYGVSEELARGPVEDQESFIYRLFPNQIDIGPNKPTSLDWLLTRTRDGTQQNAPRELIHFLNSLREVEVRRLELGETEPSGEQLFARASFKDALPEVSKVRLEQTLYSEHSTLKPMIEKLRGEKTQHTSQSLAAIWSVSEESAIDVAAALTAAGLFEARGQRQALNYWVPFLYRDALNLVQGAAE